MDMNPYPHDISTPISLYTWPCGTRMRVYSVSPIASGDFDVDEMVESLRFYHPLPYPYTWFVRGQEAAIVNINDLQFHQDAHQPRQPILDRYQPFDDHYQYSSDSVDETAILQDLNMNQINDSFEQASHSHQCSGLTHKFISKNLTLTKYNEEEESEICVVCQVEFQNKERVGVLQCRHRFHPKCIKEWLLRKNVCPLCKSQAVKV